MDVSLHRFCLVIDLVLAQIKSALWQGIPRNCTYTLVKASLAIATRNCIVFVTPSAVWEQRRTPHSLLY